MAAKPITASMPQDLDLEYNYTIRLVALDPVTGAEVSGVKFTAASIFAENRGTGPVADLATPLWIPLEDLNAG